MQLSSNPCAKEAQTVIASVEYQYGSLKIKTPALWEQVVNQEWQDAYENLLDFGDAYISRGRKEAKYLEAIL
ncbi:pesticin C-terminus-like muramidase [Aeromonas rivipollensis]|uniref:pesticin C-terminus-like muramidase n=1 Tax=Aeromonas rivipollensis TaxID=948519 RepID=UPI0038D033FF